MMPKSFLFITCVLIMLSCSATQKSIATQSQKVPEVTAETTSVSTTESSAIASRSDTIPPQVFMIDTLLKVTHGACLGQCPVYSFTILNDGSVYWLGQNFVEKKGSYIAQLPHEKIEEITKWIMQSYKNLKLEYPEPYYVIPEFPLTRLYIKNNQISKFVTINHSAPPEVKTILSKIDEWFEQTEWQKISN